MLSPGKLASPIIAPAVIKKEDAAEEDVTPKEEEHVQNKPSVQGTITKVDRDQALLDRKHPFSIAEMIPDFMLHEGDHVKATLNGNEVIKIEPAYLIHREGTVTSVGRLGGSINNEVKYLINNLKSEFSAKLGDQVEYQALASTQGIYTWRAYDVKPKVKGAASDIMNAGPMPIIPKKELEMSTEGIFITEKIDFGVMNFTQTKAIAIEIKNDGNEAQTLLNIIVNEKSAFTFEPSFESFPHVMQPGDTVSVIIACKPAFKKAKSVIIFNFEKFEIDRLMVVNMKNFQDLDMEIINLRSRNKIIRSPFIPSGNKDLYDNPDYKRRNPCHIPSMMWVHFNARNNLERMFPVLSQELTPKNYHQKFTYLLHLEEMDMWVNMQKYNMSDAGLKKEGEFLTLDIQRLDEFRPSLILGDKILLTNPALTVLRDTTVYEGHICKVSKNKVYLQFQNDFHGTYSGENYNVTFEFNRTRIKRCHFSLKIMNNAQEILFPKKFTLVPSQIELKPWFNPKLNERQQIAVKWMLNKQKGRCPYIIFGPPGTGKTITIVEAILQVYMMYPKAQILVCTPTNSAADIITSLLVETNIFPPSELVRLNAYRRIEIREELKKFCLNPDDLEECLLRRIIICTCTMSGAFIEVEKPENYFTHLFIDEAGQCTEPETLISIAQVPNGRVVLAGDHQQLGPVCYSMRAIKNGLSMSYFERLMSSNLYKLDPQKHHEYGNYNPYLVTKLVRNYRSVEELLEVPSKLFYNSELLPCPIENRLDCSSSELPLPYPFIFEGVVGEALQDYDSPSWYNPEEIETTALYLNNFYHMGLAPVDIGIITPYKKQVEKIRSQLRHSSLDVCKVGSVEEFQGQERRVIIVSTVRTKIDDNEKGDEEKDGKKGGKGKHFDFIFHPKRFNVAITRAKEILVVIGDPNLLSRDENWNELIQLAIRQGSYLGCKFTQEEPKKEEAELEESWDKPPAISTQEEAAQISLPEVPVITSIAEYPLLSSPQEVSPTILTQEAPPIYSFEEVPLKDTADDSLKKSPKEVSPKESSNFLVKDNSPKPNDSTIILMEYESPAPAPKDSTIILMDYDSPAPSPKDSTIILMEYESPALSPKDSTIISMEYESPALVSEDSTEKEPSNNSSQQEMLNVSSEVKKELSCFDSLKVASSNQIPPATPSILTPEEASHTVSPGALFRDSFKASIDINPFRALLEQGIAEKERRKSFYAASSKETLLTPQGVSLKDFNEQESNKTPSQEVPLTVSPKIELSKLLIKEAQPEVILKF